jgi:hypothetical protein
LRPAPAVLPLPVAMIEPAFGTLLMSPVGATLLPAPRLPTARAAAVALATITAGAQKEQRLALTAQAKPWPKNHFAMNRHAYPQAALDNGLGFVAGWNQFDCGGLTKVAIPEPRRSNGGVPSDFPPRSYITPLLISLMIGRMTRAFGVDDVARLRRSPKSDDL